MIPYRAVEQYRVLEEIEVYNAAAKLEDALCTLEDALDCSDDPNICGCVDAAYEACAELQEAFSDTSTWVLVNLKQFEAAKAAADEREELRQLIESQIQDRRRRQIAPKVRRQVIERDDSSCRYCGVRVDGLMLHLDHVNPRGASTIDNLVVACRPCNMKKRSTPPRQLYKIGMRLR